MHLSVQTRHALPDLAWDRFVALAGGGMYQQTSMWAQVKRLVGWHAERIVVVRAGDIVGGCQVLVRPLPVLGAVAYAPRGPVLLTPDERILDQVLSAMLGLARKRGVLYLAVQPPPGTRDLTSALHARGFVQSDLEIAPRATVRIDLGRPVDALLEATHEMTRRNVRKAQRLQVGIREGGTADFPRFGELLAQTARRQDFNLYPLEY